MTIVAQMMTKAVSEAFIPNSLVAAAARRFRRFAFPGTASVRNARRPIRPDKNSGDGTGAVFFPSAAHAAPPVVLQGTIHARAAKQKDQTYTILILQIIFSSSKETVASFTGKQAIFSTKLSKKRIGSSTG
ncbi:hypothetical protein [Desulfovibrio fairfieldensis]|uniref:hypothetical protein n=1 Tax=Desulfovibrio fairfieldensis TaxID=44742 RepID=UPI001237334B|nr:hypothetical protein [Desulfovibrio fairfieldensis]